MSAVGGGPSPSVGRRGASTADIVVAGAAGRMGNRIIACLAGVSDLRLVAALEAPGHAAIGRDAGEIAGVAQAGARAVIGTTGFGPAERAEIGELATRAAILMSPNMSVATNVAFKLLATMAKALGDEYDVEITEIHHRFKKDAPSGTALRMAEVVAAALGRDLDQVAVYGRQGLPGERTRPEIGILSLRSGDVVGEHTVSFGTLGERLELVHKAHNRDTYARGALRAARFVAGRPPGLYSMADVLGLV